MPWPGPELGSRERRGPVERARLYVTAHGTYEVEMNGRVVGDDVLAPGWSSYHHRLRYRTHDVTALLEEGANTIGATLADGCYRGRVGFAGGRSAVYGDRTALIAQLEITYSDGTTDTVATDGAWRCAPGPVTAASLHDGECHDARLLPGGGLTRARATLDTPYGRAEAGWERTGDQTELVVVVPANTTAAVHVPPDPDTAVEVGAGRHVFRWA
ncbi:alpha-L-rhamnosidase N-terminal domain-containing protein [Nonomuraea sp. C10]|uniref:alpha-L-rhamnosidase N-terminal domain-containing protein n=1 Tax=Nonomuraea sp. C10 TaxID=2600577 RepID=UPI0021C38EE0|nr:alpha-L-rhamnosidase N-terminal domain-containing protein [Nonomuraea sp. C10]